MSWLHEPLRLVPTNRNGTMRLTRWFGRWSLKGHDGTEQATPYMNALWRTVFANIVRKRAVVRRCLLLGVAMGATFGLVRKDWPEAQVVGIDWEPSLYELGKELGVHRPGKGMAFIEGDAAEIVPKLTGTFDLLLVDLFDGHRVAGAVADPKLQDAAVLRLERGGIAAVNFYDQPAVLEGWTARLGEPEMVRYQGNRIAIYVKK